MPLELLSRYWVPRRGMQVAAASVAAGVPVQQHVKDAAADHTDLFHDVQARGILVGYDWDRSFSDLDADSTSADPAIFARNRGTGPGLHAEYAGANAAIERKSNHESGIGVWASGSVGVSGFGSAAGAAGVIGANAAGAVSKARVAMVSGASNRTRSPVSQPRAGMA
jgi:hypothetical protein